MSRALSAPALLAAARRVPAPAWIVLIWAVLFLPSLGAHNFHWEEGRNAYMAQSFLRDGDWLVPTIWGEAWRERPQLYAWLVAVASWLAGTLDERVARLPAVLAILAGGLLIHALVARHAGRLAAVLGAGCWFLCPIVLNRVTAEPDLLLGVLSFAAFVVWWQGRERGRVAWWRWLLCGLLLAGIAAAKGPQQVGFFGLGVLAYTLLRRRWRDLPGLVLSGLMPALLTVGWAWHAYRPGQEDYWLAYMRLVTEDQSLAGYVANIGKFAGGLVANALPGILLAAPVWWRALRGRRGPGGDLALALLLYAGLCAVVLLFWPYARERYAIPVFPAAAAAAALLVPELLRRADRLGRALRWLFGIAFYGLAAYRLALILVVMPLRPELFSHMREVGARIDATVASDPAPLFVIGQQMHNALWYAAAEPVGIDERALDRLDGGAWLIGSSARVDGVVAARPSLSPRERVVLDGSIILVRF